jgi:hypothetical protein
MKIGEVQRLFERFMDDQVGGSLRHIVDDAGDVEWTGFVSIAQAVAGGRFPTFGLDFGGVDGRKYGVHFDVSEHREVVVEAVAEFSRARATYLYKGSSSS